MYKKTLISIATSTLITTLAVVGVTYAATPASNNTSLLNQGTVEVDSLKVGKQGSGGVTFFNGSIVNNTTNNGAGVPITFADDVRIDGRLWRGETRGTSDSKPLIIEDNAQIDGTLTVGGTDIFAAIAAKANSADVYTKTESDTKDAGNVKKTDVVTRRIAIDPSDMTAVGYINYELGSTDGSSNTPLQLQGTGSRDKFFTGVQLPDGATVTQFEAFILDNSDVANHDVFVTLEKTDSYAGTTRTHVSALNSTSASASTSVQRFISPALSHTVDNTNGGYFIQVELGTGDFANGTFNGAIITYTVAQDK